MFVRGNHDDPSYFQEEKKSIREISKLTGVSVSTVQRVKKRSVVIWNKCPGLLQERLDTIEESK